MGLLDRISARTVDRAPERRFAIDQWLSDYLLPANEFSYSGSTYPFGLNTTYLADRAKEISTTLPGYMAALRSCPPAFAAQLVRASVLSQARFCFRNADWSPKAGRVFTTSALNPLQKPWTNATTGQLINIMEWHEGLAGNAYVTNRTPGRLRVLRPDWVVIAYGSHQQPDDAAHALDGELLGYLYCNGGIAQGKYPVETLLPDEVAHWSPLPDPECAGIGMSWVTPAIREIQGDRAATEHKLKFFANGATPNMVVKGITASSKEQFEEIVDALESRHAGVRNAYRTLYLAAGADATVVGADLRQIDFKATQGAGETRISMLSRVHPVILGASEGLQGSSLNAGNFGAARRAWADTWIYPTLADLAASLASMVRVPADAELWTKTGDMPILREDAKDAAEIEQTKAATISSLITNGFTRKSVIAAVTAQDMTLLEEDPDWISVQLQAAGATGPTAGGVGPKVPAALPVRAERKFNPAEPREPHSGKWVGTGGAVRDALKLADRIDLKPGETFGGSDTISAEEGRINLAWIKRNGETHLRLGAGSGVFEEDSHKWRAADRGHTVELDTEQRQVLHSELGRMADRAKQAGAEMRELDKEYDRFYSQHGDHPSGKAASEKWLAALPPDAAAQYEDLGNRSLPYTDEPVARSAVHASWGTVRYELMMHDLQNPKDWSLVIGVQPNGAPDDWELRDGRHGTWLSPGQVKKFQGMLAQSASAGGAPLRSDPDRAAGHDVTPGHDQLHRYWVAGPGLAKWAGSPKPWTTLVANLIEEGVNPEKAKIYASRWFIEHFGFAAGSDLNRVTHGKPPRGHKVGPG